ncbi:Uncharacterised protein [Legionella bozemanae]|nr:Uncharacterised protein [Legionella bozemanae]
MYYEQTKHVGIKHTLLVRPITQVHINLYHFISLFWLTLGEK